MPRMLNFVRLLRVTAIHGRVINAINGRTRPYLNVGLPLHTRQSIVATHYLSTTAPNSFHATKNTMSHPLLGKPAPVDFVGKNQMNEDVNLAEVIEQGPVVLFFYPKDESSGCTKEVSDSDGKFTRIVVGCRTTIIYRLIVERRINYHHQGHAKNCTARLHIHPRFLIRDPCFAPASFRSVLSAINMT